MLANFHQKTSIKDVWLGFKYALVTFSEYQVGNSYIAMEEMNDVKGISYTNKISEILSVNCYLEYRTATTRLGACLYTCSD